MLNFKLPEGGKAGLDSPSPAGLPLPPLSPPPLPGQEDGDNWTPCLTWTSRSSEGRDCPRRSKRSSCGTFCSCAWMPGSWTGLPLSAIPLPALEDGGNWTPCLTWTSQSFEGRDCPGTSEGSSCGTVCSCARMPGSFLCWAGLSPGNSQPPLALPPHLRQQMSFYKSTFLIFNITLKTRLRLFEVGEK